jgi:dihydrofolate reductase
VASGDMTQEVIKLKKQPGKDLIAHGGAGFAQSLVQTGLIDEFWFLTHPVALGTGLPLFLAAAETALSQARSALRRLALVQLHTSISDRRLGDLSVT